MTGMQRTHTTLETNQPLKSLHCFSYNFVCERSLFISLKHDLTLSLLLSVDCSEALTFHLVLIYIS